MVTHRRPAALSQTAAASPQGCTTCQAQMQAPAALMGVRRGAARAWLSASTTRGRPLRARAGAPQVRVALACMKRAAEHRQRRAAVTCLLTLLRYRQLHQRARRRVLHRTRRHQRISMPDSRLRRPGHGPLPPPVRRRRRHIAKLSDVELHQRSRRRVLYRLSLIHI